jgi:hypothetical protein
MKSALAAIVCVCLVAPPARAEPCEASTVMRAGLVAPCTGVLVPGRRVAQCLAAEEDLAGCRIRLAGEVEARTIADQACADQIARLELALEDERSAGRANPTPEVRTDWGAVAWGVVVGLVVGALAVAVPVLAR